MNIFYTSTCPVECAKNLDDKRVVKMCLETAQMLCTAINESGGTAPYKSTHKNHPCNIWARQAAGHWLWLYKHFIALCWEYKKRYGKIHKSFKVLQSVKLKDQIDILPKVFISDLKHPPNCAANTSKGISYKHITQTVDAYKIYLNDRWETDSRTPTWYGVQR